MNRQVKMKIAMFKRWMSMLTGTTVVAVEQKIGKVYSLTEIKGFYNDFTNKITNALTCDSQGVPVTDIGAKDTVYFPIDIFQYGLGFYDLYLQGINIEDSYFHFIAISEWAYSMQREDGSWDCFGPIGSQKYTVSSMGQGEGCALLLRAAIETGEKKYADAAKRAIDFMLIPTEAGGTTYYWNDKVILEEYAHPEHCVVLNGWIFSIFGLYDYVKYSHDSKYEELLNKTIRSMIEMLPCFDRGYWSNYDKNGRIASPNYHKLHLGLLEAMEQISGDSIFREYMNKWKKYQDSKVCRSRAILTKIFQKLFEKTDAVVIK